jgi:hypothetical protein
MGCASSKPRERGMEMESSSERKARLKREADARKERQKRDNRLDNVAHAKAPHTALHHAHVAANELYPSQQPVGAHLILSREEAAARRRAR